MQLNRITLIVVGLLVCLGAVAYFTWPANHQLPYTKSPAGSSSGRPSGALNVAACLGSGGSQVPRDFLDSKHSSAMALIYQKHFDAAIPDLRSIAVADPGYPRINLDLSDALLQSQQAEQAKRVINSQIAISDCLIELPDNALQNYCQSELGQPDKDNCRSQLAQVKRAAHYQAALIDMTLASDIKAAAPVELAKNSPPPDPPPPAAARATKRLTDYAAVDSTGPTASLKPAPAPAVIPTPAKPATLVASARPKPAEVAAAVPTRPIHVAASPTPETVPVVASAPPKPAVSLAEAEGVAPADKAVAPKETPEAEGVLRASEASEHVGETRTVCGPVADKHTAATANGSPTFIELDRAYPNQIFTVLIWGNEKQIVGELPPSGNVCVTGKISTYAGLPEIVLHNARDWFVSYGSPKP